MNPLLTKALEERGYDTLTPVQTAVSDPALGDADLLVSAQTGSGKTVGFGLAMAPTLLGEASTFAYADAPVALVVAPTRELAFQVMRELRWLFAETGAQVVSCVGGMDMRDERRALARGAHIVVGTPGRLRDHISRGSLDMSGLRVVVLDEADEMLDLGFREDLEFMLGEAPEHRRTLMFSATVPPMIAKLAAEFQRDAQRIDTRDAAKQHADISYQAVRVADRDQENAIFNLLRFHDSAGAIVFANTRAAVNHLMARLSNRGFSVVILSGELTQGERTNALQAMRDGRARICVATDVAARGIDLPNVNLVIHADLPTNTESLLHRSGRTGRAGRKGISAMIVPPKATKKAERLLKWAKIQAEWVAAPSAEDIRKLDEERLLSDPMWDEPPTDGEAEFANRLLQRQSAETIAAAYLRLYRAGRSAPEELLPPDTRAEPKPREAFGPSTWFSLSVGRKDRAEPRWLLPLLCRAGGLDKSAIGAIRLQDAESFVEISDSAVEAFVANLGSDGVLEKGVRAIRLERPPEMAPRGGPRKPGPAREGKPSYKSDKKKWQPKDEAPQKPARLKDADEVVVSPQKAPAAVETPARKKKHKPTTQKTDANTAQDRRTDDLKPGVTAKSPKGKPGPKGKKPGKKPAAKNRNAGADARDSSKRFVPPGKTGAGRKPKPAGGATRRGGDQPPRRKKT